jgi:light-regulated signal transduction histidine kinase (bacteriophytochrome)
LIDDVLDFARGRLGGGIGLRLTEIENINAGLTAVVKELQDGQPNRQTNYNFSVNRTVRCDLGRMQQVSAIADEGNLVFEVWNAGDPIPPGNLSKVFEPFWRRETSTNREGLGLGLHICAQILRAHGGQLSVKSSREAGIIFTARVPLHLVPS